MLDIGSTLLSNPDNVYIKNCFQCSEWDIDFDKKDSTERIQVVRKKFLNTHERTLIWIDIFSDVFPDKIVSDSKRISFDIVPIGMLRNVTPSFFALSSLYISSQYHKFDFMGMIEDLIELRGAGREVFGIKRKRISAKWKQIKLIKKYADLIYQQMPDKFEKFDKMYKKLEGLDDRKELGIFQGNKQN